MHADFARLESAHCHGALVCAASECGTQVRALFFLFLPFINIPRLARGREDPYGTSLKGLFLADLQNASTTLHRTQERHPWSSPGVCLSRSYFSCFFVCSLSLFCFLFVYKLSVERHRSRVQHDTVDEGNLYCWNIEVGNVRHREGSQAHQVAARWDHLVKTQPGNLIH